MLQRRQRAAACAVDAAQPHIRRAVRSAYRKAPDHSGVFTVEDVEQEVLARLLTQPPRAALESDTKMAALCSWAKKVAFRLLLDDKRRIKTRHRQSFAYPDRRRPKQHERAEARGELAHVEALLSEHYPRGLNLVTALKLNPEAGPKELAEALGTSLATVHKIRSRIRKVVAGQASRTVE